jgi:hypothetical protein
MVLLLKEPVQRRVVFLLLHPFLRGLSGEEEHRAFQDMFGREFAAVLDDGEWKNPRPDFLARAAGVNANTIIAHVNRVRAALKEGLGPDA